MNKDIDESLKYLFEEYKRLKLKEKKQKLTLEEHETLKKLSKTNEKQILKYWEGLGYYRRARHLLATSKIIIKEKNSILPKTLIDIKKLPGVGDYTGNALLGLVYNQPRIALDGGRDGLNKIKTVIDHWKFTKKISSQNPNWYLAEIKNS